MLIFLCEKHSFTHKYAKVLSYYSGYVVVLSLKFIIEYLLSNCVIFLVWSRLENMPNQNGVVAFESHSNSNGAAEISDGRKRVEIRKQDTMTSKKDRIDRLGQYDDDNASKHRFQVNIDRSDDNIDGRKIQRPLRIMIITESFHPYTSGIARRFKEVLQRLAKRGFRVHILTGCKVSRLTCP